MQGERLGVQAGGWRGGRPEAGAGDRARDTRQQAAPARHEIHALLQLLRRPGIDSKEVIPPAYVARTSICKRLWSPGIDSEESISPTYAA
jgi:hypothetical protein